MGEKRTGNIDNTNIDLTSYIKPTNALFSFNELQTADVTHLLATIISNKATGLDGIYNYYSCNQVIIIHAI